MELDIRKTTGSANSYCIYFNGDPSEVSADHDWNNGYKLTMNTNGEWNLVQIINGAASYLQQWSPSSALNTGTNWNTIKIESLSGVIKIYFNGQLVGNFNSTTFIVGYFGIGVFDDYYSGEIECDNVTLNLSGKQAALGTISELTPTTIKASQTTQFQNETAETETFRTEWKPVSKDKDFNHFNIYRNNQLIGTSNTQSYNDVLTASGSYTYKITAQYNGGESIPSETISFSYVHSSIHQLSESSVQINPNPTNGMFRINSENEIKNITIVDVTGKILQQNALESYHTELNISAFPQGVYFLKIETINGVVFKKIMKQ